MIDINQVSSVYSGRKGCACGCRGKYAYASAHTDTRPSYYTADDGISDRSVKTITNRVMALIADPQADIDSVMVDTDGDWIAVDMNNDRTYTIYFR